MRLLAACCVVSLGCATTTAEVKPAPAPVTPPPPAAPAPPPPTPSQRFAALVDDVLAEKESFQPTFAVGMGHHQHDAELEDLSRARIEKHLATQKAQLETLRALDRAQLSFDERIDAEALDATLEAEVVDLGTMQSWTHNPMDYAGLPGGAIDALMKRNFAPSTERLKLVDALLKQVPAVYAAAKANLVNPPKEFTDLAIRMAKGSVGFFQESVTEWAKEPLAKDPAQRAEFEAANTAAADATKAFATWLEQDLKPRSKGVYALGAEAFLRKLKLEEMIDLPLPELLARGEAQLAKDAAAFAATAKKIDPRKTPAQVMKLISAEHPTADDLIPSVRRSVDAARQYLVDKDLITLPSEVKPLIEETPAYARSGTFASMDTPGPDETVATEAFYYVTPVEKDWDQKHKDEHLRLYNPYVVAAINVHEAYPGHYTQFLYAKSLPTKVRRFIFSGANAEGWAHYAEQMMADQGFLSQTPKHQLAQLQEALLRDCRYVVGIKLHTAGWTVEQGAKYFVEHGYQEPANAYEESRRGAYNPTYLYYTAGKLEIQRLRDDYLAAKKGTLKQFHDTFVSKGALPVALVRRLVLEAPAP
ncbi:MAG: DUF885 domain-containing protein [Myxococcaceae bacterium]|nr:DUF885 domain-containing protein [Myxococcaceae bacterium]